MGGRGSERPDLLAFGGATRSGPFPVAVASDRGVEGLAIAGIVGFIGNEAVAQYRIRIGRQIGSAARSSSPSSWTNRAGRRVS